MRFECLRKRLQVPRLFQLHAPEKLHSVVPTEHKDMRGTVRDCGAVHQLQRLSVIGVCGFFLPYVMRGLVLPDMAGDVDLAAFLVPSSDEIDRVLEAVVPVCQGHSFRKRSAWEGREGIP